MTHENNPEDDIPTDVFEPCACNKTNWTCILNVLIQSAALVAIVVAIASCTYYDNVESHRHSEELKRIEVENSFLNKK